MAAHSAGGVVVHLDEADPAEHAPVLDKVTKLLDDFPVELVVRGGELSAACWPKGPRLTGCANCSGGC